MLGGPAHSGPENERRKVEEKVKVDQGGTGRAFLGEESQDLESWPEEESVLWSKA